MADIHQTYYKLQTAFPKNLKQAVRMQLVNSSRTDLLQLVVASTFWKNLAASLITSTGFLQVHGV